MSDTLNRVKSALKRAAPVLYDEAHRAATSEFSRTLRALPSLPEQNRLIKQNAPQFAVDVKGEMGIGAMLSWVVGILGYCQANSLYPRLAFTNPLYATAYGEDWLDRYFMRLPWLVDDRGDELIPRYHYITTGVNLMRRLKPIYRTLSLSESHVLFESALSFRAEILEEVEHFCRVQRVTNSTVAVHFRGTDKRSEATLPSQDLLIDTTEIALSMGKRNVFVATDEPDFLRRIKNRLGKFVVHLDCKEVYAGIPAHYAAGDPAQKAREALLTMLVLARAGLLIRTRSHLSAWSKILNPQLQTIVFGAMRSGDQFNYPEHLITTEIDVSRPAY